MTTSTWIFSEWSRTSGQQRVEFGFPEFVRWYEAGSAYWLALFRAPWGVLDVEIVAIDEQRSFVSAANALRAEIADAQR